MKATLIILAIFLCATVIAQPKEKKSVVIGKMTTKENALLILNPPDGNQGVILPQLSTAQRTSLKASSPSENGLTVFDTDLKSFFYWSDGRWVRSLSDNTTRTSFFTIDPLDFYNLQRSGNLRHNNQVIFESDNTFVTASRNDAGEEIMASVNIPHGAIVKEFTIYYMDNDIPNLKVKFMRKSFSGSNEDMVSWESVGTDPVIKPQSFSSFNGLERIDLENYTYRILIAFDVSSDDHVTVPSDARQRVYGVKIKYQE